MFLLPGPPMLEFNATSGTPVTALVLVVINSILEVFFLCLVGWILARRGIVDDKAKKVLNKLNVSLFTPALLFSKVAFSLSPQKLKELWIIPCGFVIITCLSATVAWGMGRVFKLSKGQRSFAIACAMFQNSNSLPIALMQSLIGEKMPLAWGPKDSKDQMLGRALSYLVLFSTLGIIVRWSIGVRLLTSAEAEPTPRSSSIQSARLHDDDLENEEEARIYNDQTPLLSDAPSQRRRKVGNGGSESPPSDDSDLSKRKSTISFANTDDTIYSPGSPTTVDKLIKGKPSRTTLTLNNTDSLLIAESNAKANGNGHQTLGDQHRKRRKARPQSIFQSFPNTPAPSVPASEYNSDEESDRDEEDDEWGVRRGIGRELGPWEKRWVGVKRRFNKISKPVVKVANRIGSFMTVPLWAAVLSLVVACIPPLQAVLNEIEPLKSSIKNAGNCSVPITLVTLGAYFYRPSTPSPASASLPDPAPSNASISPPTFFSRLNLARLNPYGEPVKAPESHSEIRLMETKVGETRTVLVAVITRMIIVPMILLPVFGYYAAYTCNVADDPVFVVVACLLIGSPTAITLAQITSSASGEVFEILISRTLFVSYAIMTAPCTIGLVMTALFIDSKQRAAPGPA